jgi:hypothetical protein
MTKPISFASEIPEDFYKLLTEKRELHKGNILEEFISMSVIPIGYEEPQIKTAGAQQPRVMMQIVYSCLMIVKQ